MGTAENIIPALIQPQIELPCHVRARNRFSDVFLVGLWEGRK